MILLKLLAVSAIVALPALPTPAAAMAQAPARPMELVPPPPRGMGQVVFYRPSAIYGMLASCRVREGDTVVNRLPSGKYFIHQTTPGPHQYNARGGARDYLRVEVEEGETQYVRCTIGHGIVVVRPNLSPQSREDFDRHGRNLQLLPRHVPENDD
jgi:hypothetical protein